MPGLSPEFVQRLDPILADLGRRLGIPALHAEFDPTTDRVRVQGETVRVPAKHEIHWRRFQTLPTDLVREAAYALARRSQDEADAHAFAEAFLRDAVLWTD